MAFWIPAAIGLAVEGVLLAIDYFSAQSKEESKEPPAQETLDQMKEDLETVTSDPAGTEALSYYDIDGVQLNALRQSIANAEADLQRSHIRKEQAQDRKSRALQGLAVQSVGGQRKHLKEAAAHYRDEEQRINKDIVALAQSVARKGANYDALMDIGSRPVTGDNTTLATAITAQTGVGISPKRSE